MERKNVAPDVATPISLCGTAFWVTNTSYLHHGTETESEDKQIERHGRRTRCWGDA